MSVHVLGTELSAEERVVNKTHTFSALTGLVIYQKKQTLNDHYRIDCFIAVEGNGMREKEEQHTVRLHSRGD